MSPPARAGGTGGPGGIATLMLLSSYKCLPPLKKFFNGLLDDLPQHPYTSVLEKIVVVLPVLEDVQIDF